MNFHSPICQDRQPVPLRYVSEARGGDVMLQFCKRCKHGSLARCQPFLNVVLLFSVWQKRKIQVFSWQICYCWSPFVALRCPEQFLTSFKKYIDHQVGIHTKLSQSRHARCAPRPTATVSWRWCHGFLCHGFPSLQGTQSLQTCTLVHDGVISSNELIKNRKKLWLKYIKVIQLISSKSRERIWENRTY